MDISYILQILIGFVGLVLLAIPFSSNKKIINYRHAIYAILFQLFLAFILIKVPFITNLFSYLAEGVAALQIATGKGTEFVFGYLGGGDLPFELAQKGSALIFAFSILPFIIVMSSITAVLWYWGILPLIECPATVTSQKWKQRLRYLLHLTYTLMSLQLIMLKEIY